MELPFISVIVPAYNEEKFIGNCLKALAGQSYPKTRYEIIVVDNNSRDKTVEIAKKYSARIVEEKKQGITYARIRGIKASTGQIIAFVDADCIVNKSWLKTMIGIYLKNNKVVGVAQFLDFRPKKALASVCEAVTNAGLKVFKIMPGGHFSFKRSAYDKCGGFSPKIQYSEDIFISKKIKKFGKIVVLKKGLVRTSSRRFNTFKTSMDYVAKVLISDFTISIFDRSLFHLKKVEEESKRKPLKLLKKIKKLALLKD